MAKKDVKLINLSREEQDALTANLNTDPRYSLDPDPTGRLGLDDKQKKFLKCYDEFPSIPLAANMAGLTEEEGRDIFLDPACKNERQRINRARNYRKFNYRLLTIDEVGSYLTAMLIDDDMSAGDRLSSKDKLQVTRQIIDLNKIKAEALANPKIIENVDYSDAGIQDLEPEDLKKLIEQTKQNNDAITGEKHELITKINKDGNLDDVDLEHLWACSVSELKQLLEEMENQTNDKDLHV